MKGILKAQRVSTPCLFPQSFFNMAFNSLLRQSDFDGIAKTLGLGFVELGFSVEVHFGNGWMFSASCDKDASVHMTPIMAAADPSRKRPLMYTEALDVTVITDGGVLVEKKAELWFCYGEFLKARDKLHNPSLPRRTTFQVSVQCRTC